MVGPTPSTEDSSSSAAAVDRRRSSRSAGPAPAPRSGRRAGWRAPPAPATASRSLASARLSSSLTALLPRLPSLLTKNGDRGQLLGVEREQVALVGDDPGVEQRRGAPCSRAPRCRSAPRPARWNTRSRSCAGQLRRVGAADVDVALLGRRERGAAGRAVRSASRTAGRRRGAGRPPGRAPRGSRRRPCAAPPCRRSARPCARPRGRCAGWRSATVEPATRTGSSTANGVTRPVRPTLTSMSSSLVVTSSGGYLKAIAQRGARLVEPSRPWMETGSTLTTTPSISCSTSCRCSA